MDRPDGPLDAEGMTPLGSLIKAAMDRHGWSTHEVARQGGPSASTVGRLVSPDPSVDRRPPSDANLRKLATALRIPIGRLESAVADTRGWSARTTEHSQHIEDVLSTMRSLDERGQRAVAEIVSTVYSLLFLKDWDHMDDLERVRQRRPQTDPVTLADGVAEWLDDRAALAGDSQGRALREELDRQSELVSPPPDHDEGA